MRPPNSISYISALLGEAAVRDLPSMRQNVATLIAERAWLEAALAEVAEHVLPSCTNFLLARWSSVEAATRAQESGITFSMAAS